MKLFDEYISGNLKLKNRIVMAPMTRSRAINNDPNDIMVEYYRQRSGAGLIITEGTAPSPNGLGYARIPGIYSDSQLRGWDSITDAVHREGGKIFLQIMHTGRASHNDNMPEGAQVVAPSPIALNGEMYTDVNGMQPYPVPKEMTEDDINKVQDEYVNAAKNAIAAGFDGIELHGANGYLIDQFINPGANKRTDNYGGSPENRNRFAIEVARKVAEAIGPEHTAIRLSPYGVFNDMEIFDGIEDAFEHLAIELNKLKLLYIHLVDHASMGAPEVPDSIKQKIRNAFKGILIMSGGMNKNKAQQLIDEKKGDLMAFARGFLANPDLVLRLDQNLPLNEPDHSTFYTPGEKGYTDYPVHK